MARVGPRHPHAQPAALVPPFEAWSPDNEEGFLVQGGVEVCTRALDIPGLHQVKGRESGPPVTKCGPRVHRNSGGRVRNDQTLVCGQNSG